MESAFTAPTRVSDYAGASSVQPLDGCLMALQYRLIANLIASVIAASSRVSRNGTSPVPIGNVVDVDVADIIVQLLQGPPRANRQIERLGQDPRDDRCGMRVRVLPVSLGLASDRRRSYWLVNVFGIGIAVVVGVGDSVGIGDSVGVGAGWCLYWWCVMVQVMLVVMVT